MINKYRILYKCPMCNKFITNGEPFEMEENDIPVFLGKVVRNQQMIGNPYLYEAPMYIPHKCNNGNGGLARFSGIEKICI